MNTARKKMSKDEILLVVIKYIKDYANLIIIVCVHSQPSVIFIDDRPRLSPPWIRRHCITFLFYYW
jgi:hypothetical protein